MHKHPHTHLHIPTHAPTSQSLSHCSGLLELCYASVTTEPQRCWILFLLKGISRRLLFCQFSLIKGDNGDTQRGNILMVLWLTSIAVDVYIIINHVMCHCLLLETQPTEELFRGRALYLLLVADVLRLSHFVQVQEAIGPRGVSI